MTIGSLFSGIGGLELGLERAGLGPVLWQVEKEPYCREVLSRRWPYAERFDDVQTVGSHNLKRVDIICGGFPCQDISLAGAGAGLSGKRSGLWSEFARVIRDLRPRYVVVENVAAFLVRGMDVVLGTLASIGYDAEWSTLSACSMGAPHVRRRLFIVAYAYGEHGRSRFWNTTSRSVGSLQTVDGFKSARTRYATRLANPSELYRGADGVPNRLERNRAIGNAVAPDCAELVGRLIAGHVAREAGR
jgi:DNA (cytosine-5)-methyltransferase 1